MLNDMNKIKKVILNIFRKKQPNSVVEKAINAIIKTIPKNPDEYINDEDLIQLIVKNKKVKATLEKLIGVRVVFGGKDTRKLIVKNSRRIIKLFRKRPSCEIDQKLIDSILNHLLELKSEE
jgi:Ca2+-binding EF-hand superfamily protein